MRVQQCVRFACYARSLSISYVCSIASGSYISCLFLSGHVHFQKMKLHVELRTTHHAIFICVNELFTIQPQRCHGCINRYRVVLTGIGCYELYRGNGTEWYAKVSPCVNTSRI